MHDPLAEIVDGDVLYRWISPQYIKRNGKVSSGAYKRWSSVERKLVIDPRISVDLARLTDAEKMRMRSTRPDTRIGAISVAILSQLGLSVRHEPDEANGNPAHCVIEGDITDDVCRQLADDTDLLP